MVEIINDYKNLIITDIKVYRFDIPLLEPFDNTTTRIDKARNVLIQITTNAGIEGWGEGSAFFPIMGKDQLINFTAARESVGFLIGRNPLEITSLISLLDRHLPHNPIIKSAFDMALYDIAAKAVQMPLYMFLNGRKRKIETNYTIGLCSPEMAATKALMIVGELGFNILKVRLDSDFESSYQRLKSIRAAVGPKPTIRVDANESWWDRMFAVRCLNSFEEFKIELCEQPCLINDYSAFKFIGSNTTIPIMADESVISPSSTLHLICQDVAPYFGISLSRIGGITKSIRIANIAESSNRPCMIGCVAESRLGISAAAHFALSNEIIQFYDLDSFYEHAEDPILNGITIKNGIITIPDEPGIGASPDPVYLKKLETI
ncbi:MAG: dipeptide epimerase [Bacteroidales bacterium]|nr:dipeptide epimerase [Bacteroidales bacterium]